MALKQVMPMANFLYGKAIGITLGADIKIGRLTECAIVL
jgi:hypothetical protein